MSTYRIVENLGEYYVLRTIDSRVDIVGFYNSWEAARRLRDLMIEGDLLYSYNNQACEFDR